VNAPSAETIRRGLVRPRDLLSNKPYRWAGVLLVILALSPLLALSDTLIRPLAKSQYVARTVGGLIIAGMIVLIHLGWLLVGAALSRALQHPSWSRAINVTLAAVLVATTALTVLG